jgi:hypothetical protein
MYKKIAIAALIGAVCLPVSATAQQEEEDETYIYATYMICDTTRQEEADKIFEDVHMPILDAAVSDGAIDGYGWLAHHTGGKWRRIRYHSAGSIEGLLTGLETVGEKISEASGDDDSYGQICNMHDDYIWHSVAGNGGETRGKVSMSAYHVCDMAREGRADEIVKTVFAKHYDANLGAGKLSSWGWSEHIVGGKYRRLSTMTADDWPTLFAMRAAIFEAIGEEDNPLADEFSEICSSHSDYMWEIAHEK